MKHLKRKRPTANVSLRWGVLFSPSAAGQLTGTAFYSMGIVRGSAQTKENSQVISDLGVFWHG